MEFYKLVIKIFTLTFILPFAFISCKEFEQALELSLEKQKIGEAFTLAEYCEGDYDSIYIIYPYDIPDTIQKLPYKMSKPLRNYCSCTSSDSYSTILFISNGVVEAYSEVTYDKAIFSPPQLPENMHTFSYNQSFILDKDRWVHIYNN